MVPTKIAVSMQTANSERGACTVGDECTHVWIYENTGRREPTWQKVVTLDP